MPFNVARITQAAAANRYERRIALLQRQGRYTDSIKSTIEEAMRSLDNCKSFVIYGEPQSGKTEMMIALTAKLLDRGHRIIVVLLNDNVQLLKQNLARFRASGLDPAPNYFEEILAPEIHLARGRYVIFSKKNARDLTKLNEKLRSVRDSIVIIDDEADFATPNAKVNRGEKTRINELVERLRGDEGIYIGVTATPARLNLNRTFNNETEHWVIFHAHPEYIGRSQFFPTDLAALDAHDFRLTLLPDQHDDQKYLRNALFGFLVNVAYLNTVVDDHERNYSMLIHTSGARLDHSVDYKVVLKLFEVLTDKDNAAFERRYREIWELAEQRYPGYGDQLCRYIYENARRRTVVVMNSTPKGAAVDYDTATNPRTLFTIAIGGNIVSRGVTFNNLLSMFFTRDVKHRIQQDTYIQRARMFGSREPYLKYFELSIPSRLYLDWHRCFLYHSLALLAIETENKSPVWVEDPRIAAVASSSIERSTVNMDGGEMSFRLFEYDAANVAQILNQQKPAVERLKALRNLVGENALPEYLINFMAAVPPGRTDSISILAPTSVAGYKAGPGIDKRAIVRNKGFLGTTQLGRSRSPNAQHFVRIIHNGDGLARVFYKFDRPVAFLQRVGRRR